MCIEVKEAFVTDKPIIAWKLVRVLNLLQYASLSRVYDRPIQPGFKSAGKRFIYSIGKTVESDIEKTPGIYLYKNRPFSCNRVFTVEIPKGTRCVRGRSLSGRQTINAERIKVLGWA